jgi:hypothetical protein
MVEVDDTDMSGHELSDEHSHVCLFRKDQSLAISRTAQWFTGKAQKSHITKRRQPSQRIQKRSVRRQPATTNQVCLRPC